MLHFSPLSEGPLLQNKVIVGGRVHGIEHVGVFWNLQLWRERDREWCLRGWDAPTTREPPPGQATSGS